MGCCGNKTNGKGGKSPVKSTNPWAAKSSATAGSASNKTTASIFGAPKIKSSRLGR